ncbi:hypothetical protein P2318_33885 [Myxococcaceae bacterium GXIMD 01537]
MAQNPRVSSENQPVEDMFGRPTGVRHEEIGTRPRERDEPGMPGVAHEARSEEEEDDGSLDDLVGSLDDISDGDGLRSDLGTNPLPEVYWSAYPDRDR